MFAGMDVLFQTLWGRVLLAVGATVVAGVSLYRGRTHGRFAVDSDESEPSFAVAVAVEMLVAAAAWVWVLMTALPAGD